MTLLTNNMRKTYASLATAKGRRKLGLFMAQGHKCVSDTIDNFNVEAIIANEEWARCNERIIDNHNLILCKPEDMQRISTLTSPPDVIGIYQIPEYEKPDLYGRLIIALDCLQDPGNLGTIMRVCDWMGVSTILASNDTVDVWSPKVVQSTMGAISRVRLYYCDLPEVLSSLNGMDIDVYGTFLDGESIYDADLAATGIIVMGNEGNGISVEVSNLITRKITIPPYPAGSLTSESLNVAIATGITLAEFRRRLS